MSDQVAEAFGAAKVRVIGKGLMGFGSYAAVLVWSSTGLGALLVGLVSLRVAARGLAAIPVDPSSARPPVDATTSRALGG